MLCKIERPDSNVAASPMSWQHMGPPGGGPSGPLFQQQPSPAQDDAANVAKLRQQLLELEAKMHQQVVQARDLAFREGEKKGRELAVAEQQPALERLSRAIADQAGHRPQLRKQAESDLLSLALAIARRVIRRELATDPEAIAGVAKAALEKINARELTRVMLHPSHEHSVRSCLQKLNVIGNVEIISDAAMQPGDVVFETERGKLDASVETQLQEIERGLSDRL
jgi:flagellar assembly protein FliH